MGAAFILTVHSVSMPMLPDFQNYILEEVQQRGILEPLTVLTAKELPSFFSLLMDFMEIPPTASGLLALLPFPLRFGMGQRTDALDYFQ